MPRQWSHRLRNENGITEGVIWQQILIYFFPILLGTFFQQMYNTADAIIVGQFVGKEALAAVGGTTGTLINLLVGFFIGMSSGATVVIAQFYGARDDESVSRAVHTSIALALAASALLMAIGIPLAPVALTAMGTPPEVLPGAIDYMRIFFGGIVACLLYNVGSGILRAVGDSRRPLYFLIVCCVANVGLDILFVTVFKMGVRGVAIATVLAQAIAAVLVMVTLMRTRHSYRLDPRKMRFDTRLLGRILRIGLPAGVQSAMYAISNIIIQSNMNAFGTDTMAAWTAFGKLDSFFWMIIGAFGVSITTFVGQNLGAGKLDRVKKSVRVCLAMSFGVTLIISPLFIMFRTQLLGMFTSDASVIGVGGVMMMGMAPYYVTYICIEIFSGAMRGAGEALGPMLLTCFGICVLRVVWLFTYVPAHNTVTAVVASYPLTWFLTSILFVIYYYKSGWLARAQRKFGLAD